MMGIIVDSTSASSSPSMPYVTAFCTVPNSEVADNITNDVLSNKLVACVNVIPGIKSSYWWEGKVAHDNELLLLMKTHQELVPQLTEKIVALHPYEVPELIIQPIVGGHPEYLSWIGESTIRGKS